MIDLCDKSADNIMINPAYTSAGDNNLTSTEKERYLLYHRYFAHLGSQKFKNPHLVTNLKRPIKIPNLREARLCEVCLLIKMRNKTSNELVKWKTTKLALIHFNITSPFP